MRKKLLAKYREEKFAIAHRILRKAAERHGAAGHDVNFEAVNESHVRLECINCPDFTVPLSEVSEAG